MGSYDDNQDVLRRLRNEGDDLSLARPIDFVMAFPNEDAAKRFLKACLENGYEFEDGGAPDELSETWDVYVRRTMVPDLDDITEFEAELDDLAAALGGWVDGWGCFPASQPH